MSNELDELMDRDPMELSAQDIDKIISWHRQQRATYEAGGKIAKPAGQKIDLKALGLIKAPVAGTEFKRRI